MNADHPRDPATHRDSPEFPGSGPKQGLVAVSGDRIISPAMDAMVKKRALAEHQEREIISYQIERILPIPAITRDCAPAVNNGPVHQKI
jgi:hypothetical protein